MPSDQPAYVIEKFLRNVWFGLSYGWDREKTIANAAAAASAEHPTRVRTNDAKSVVVFRSDEDLIDAQE